MILGKLQDLLRGDSTRLLLESLCYKADAEGRETFLYAGINFNTDYVKHVLNYYGK